MSARPSLVRSIPFWILLAGSLATIAAGAWLVNDKLTTMNATLLDGTATGVEVYGGQSLITVGAALIGAGIVGLVAALFLGVLRSFVPVAPVEVVEPIDWTSETESDEVETPAAEVVEPAAAPASDEVAEPVAETSEPVATR
ncbi:hypothetical protein [Microbacterium sp. SS28]|uniref:hypothetical protein n=1 Tax=Microbacterium sp. SS28 TaxID=2919948 RepID=UPI001FAAB731|nr:hypothetical protein [Microbacterium sp. SS28]